jgi:hypothetical protein
VTIRAKILVAALAATTFASSAPAQKPSGSLNTLKELSEALFSCWIPPPLEQSRVGMQITLRMSFKRNGELLGQPRISFETAGASDDQRLAYRIAVAEMIRRCTPLPFTESLGGAIAGRPFTIRFVDDRGLKRT